MRTQKGFTTIFALVVIAILGIGSYILYFSPSKNFPEQVEVNTTDKGANIKEITQTENTLTLNEPRVYTVEVESLKESTIPIIELYKFVFGESLGTGYEGFYLDKDFDSNLNENTLFLLSESKAFGVGDVLQNERLRVTILKESPEIEPYLRDTKYCNNDGDCSENAKYCSIGSFNIYSKFWIWGCSGITSIEGHTTEELEALNCPMSLYPTYTGEVLETSCIDNQCTATNVNIFCIEETYQDNKDEDTKCIPPGKTGNYFTEGDYCCSGESVCCGDPNCIENGCFLCK